MKKTITILIILASINSFSQLAIVKSSIDSGGASVTNGNISILYTIGEVNVQETNVGSLHISEGFVNPSLKIRVNPKLFLQGSLLNPATAGLMNDDLRSLNYLPTTSPYADASTVNASVFTVTGSNAVVDWIWVELRDTADNTNVKSAQSALLQRDGDVVALDGVSNLTMSSSPGNYYVVIKHRNHLGVMSSNDIALSGAETIVDFTDSNFSTYGNNAQVQLASGDMALWAGDTNNNKQINFSGAANDANVIKDDVLSDPTNGFNSLGFASTGYLLFDIDMNGSGKFSGTGNDSNIIKDNVLAHPTNGFNSQSYIINSTVPNSTSSRNNVQQQKIQNKYLPPSEKVRLENEALSN